MGVIKVWCSCMKHSDEKKSEIWLEEEPADVGDARTMRHHLLLPTGSVMSPRELCLTYSKAGGADSSKPFKVPDIGHRAT